MSNAQGPRRSVQDDELNLRDNVASSRLRSIRQIWILPLTILDFKIHRSEDPLHYLHENHYAYLCVPCPYMAIDVRISVGPN